MISLSPMSPEDLNVPVLVDFSNLLAAGETITGTPTVTPAPSSITAGAPVVVDGIKSASAVQFTLGAGKVNQGYLITVEIVTSNNVTLARSVFVTVQSL
jgi:hypothetical protein